MGQNYGDPTASAAGGDTRPGNPVPRSWAVAAGRPVVEVAAWVPPLQLSPVCSMIPAAAAAVAAVVVAAVGSALAPRPTWTGIAAACPHPPRPFSRPETKIYAGRTSSVSDPGGSVFKSPPGSGFYIRIPQGIKIH